MSRQIRFESETKLKGLSQVVESQRVSFIWMFEGQCREESRRQETDGEWLHLTSLETLFAGREPSLNGLPFKGSTQEGTPGWL